MNEQDRRQLAEKFNQALKFTQGGDDVADTVNNAVERVAENMGVPFVPVVKDSRNLVLLTN